MPATQTKTSWFSKKYGQQLKNSVKAHASDDIRTGIIRIPGGITRGIAKLKEAYFGTGEKGDFFRVAGIIQEPTEVISEGMKVRVIGLQTSQVVMISEAKFDDNVADITNYLKMLGGADCVQEGSDLESVAAALEKAEPPIYFYFSTELSKEDPTKKDPKTGKPYPSRVWERWHGSEGLDDYAPPFDAKSAVKDKTETIPSKNGKPSQSKEADDTPDIDDLVTQANDGSDEAKDKLEELFKALGYNDKDVEDAPSWSAIGEIVKAGTEKGSDAPEENPKVPEKGDVCSYTPTDKRGKKLKPVECKVTTVVKKDKMVNLVKVDDAKVKYEAVAWDDLTFDE